MATLPRVVIVGGGIIGASIAQALSAKRVSVVLLDEHEPVRGTSRASFGWINAQTSVGEAYFRLRAQSLLEYRRLEKDLGGSLPLRWGGSLTWNRPREVLERRIAALSALGYAIKGVGQDEIRRLEPGYVGPPDFAVYCESEAAVDAESATLALLSAAKSNGAALHFKEKVSALVARGGVIAGVATEAAAYSADVVVIASGSGTQTLCEAVGVPMPLERTLDYVVGSEPCIPILNTVINTPFFHARQESDGRIIAGGDLAEDREILQPETYGNGLLERVSRHLKLTHCPKLREVRAGVRVVPMDEMPVLGFAPGRDNLYIAVTHSGVTLAPIIGRIVTDEILGTATSLLVPEFRPQRFAPGVAGE
jgi:glycine/D-amino acid oxidase-like deaminating enzyme